MQGEAGKEKVPRAVVIALVSQGIIRRACVGRVALKTFGLFPVTGRFHVLCPVTGFHVSEVLFRGVPAGDPGRAR